MRTALIIWGVLSTFISSSQTYRYFFDDQFNITDQQKAVITARGLKSSTGVLAEFKLIQGNQLLFITEFTDSTLAIKNGINQEYYRNGNMALFSHYKSDILDGAEMKWNEEGQLTDSCVYDMGEKVFASIHQYKNKHLICTSLEDVRNATLKIYTYDTSGVKTEEVFFEGNTGTMKHYIAGALASTDSLFTREEKEASFPGGRDGWIRFLQKNLDADMLIRRGARGGSGTVIAQFVVEKDGSLSNIKTLTDIGFGAEQEVIRVLKKSPKWIPATQYGKHVKAYRIQPVTFAIRSL